MITHGLPLALLVAAGCATSLPPVPVVTPEVEIALDDGRAAEQPLTPPRAFEMLIRVDAKLPRYRLLRMRFLLAQPGHIVFTVYASDGEGRPGGELKTIDRSYGAELTSSSTDGKWIVESLDGVPPQTQPVYIGAYCPEKASDPRLWASSNDSGSVFERDADTTVPLDRQHIPRTPKLRVAVQLDQAAR